MWRDVPYLGWRPTYLPNFGVRLFLFFYRDGFQLEFKAIFDFGELPPGVELPARRGWRGHEDERRPVFCEGQGRREAGARAMRNRTVMGVSVNLGPRLRES